MIRVVACLLVTLSLAGCGTDDKQMSLSQALCNDLDSGLNLMNIWPRDMDPEKFAQHVDVATRTECPEYRSRVDIRTYLQNWGYE